MSDPSTGSGRGPSTGSGRGPSTTKGRGPVERALGRIAAGRRAQPEEGAESLGSLSPPAFRAAVDERLRSLERQLEEVKGRVNGLLFLLAGAVATQVVRLLG